MRWNSIFWKFCFFKILLRGENQRFQWSKLFQKFQFFCREQDGSYQDFDYGEFSVSRIQYRDETEQLSVYGRSESQYSNAKKKVGNITITNNFQLRKIFWDFHGRNGA